MFSPSVSTSLFSRSWNSAHRGLLKKSKYKFYMHVKPNHNTNVHKMYVFDF